MWELFCFVNKVTKTIGEGFDLSLELTTELIPLVENARATVAEIQEFLPSFQFLTTELEICDLVVVNDLNPFATCVPAITPR